jgi:phosphocarrier protein
MGVAVSTEIRRTMEIVNKLGVHARAAAKLIELASGFESRIRICRDDHEADGKSIMKVMTLAASKGTSIEIVAQGDDAAEAVEAIERLVAGRFGEPE